MISFSSDYTEGCAEEILDALYRTNREQLVGYGHDSYSKRAKAKIAAACACPQADVWFLNGGTQTNQLVIDTMLAPYEGVLAAATGHVNVHEAGAIEFSGHKVLTVPQHDGKVDADEVAAYIETFYKDGNHEHMVFPGMLYVSHPTEYGTLYTAAELLRLSEICHAHGMTFFLDGARLGYALAADGTDVTLPLLASVCDVFYIGGTKVGALSGEALVFTKHNTPKYFETCIKQHGALSAKGRLIGIQFDTLFTDDLYFKLGRHAIEAAARVKEICRAAGYRFYLDSPTNQQFFVVDNKTMEKLSTRVGFGYWEPFDATHTVIRFATSWMTPEAHLLELARILQEVAAE